MAKYTNSLKKSFIDNFPRVSIDDPNDKLTLKSKFNFAYFDSSQEPSQDFSDWSHTELIDLFEKLKSFSNEPLHYWLSQVIGSGKHRQHVLEIYGSFPKKSDFKHPLYVPFEAQWARFRINNLSRLIGFVIPAKSHAKQHSTTHEYFDKNTFYVVFLDRNHRFYLT